MTRANVGGGQGYDQAVLAPPAPYVNQEIALNSTWNSARPDGTELNNWTVCAMAPPRDT